MGFENFDLDQVAENARKRSTGDNSAGDLYYDPADGKMKVAKRGTEVPAAGVVANQMTDEGFA